MAWRDLILRDFWLKLFSLLLAVLLWLTVHFFLQRQVGQGGPMTNPLTPVVTTDFPHLPIKVIKPATDLRVYRVTPSDVEISVQGNPDLLGLLSAEDIEVSIDLTQVKTDQPFHQKVNLRPPKGVTVLRLSPEEVRVELIRSTPP